MFCTYAHYTPQGRLFYIGKGSNELRAYRFTERNNYWHKIVNKYGKPDVQILANWDTEEEAFSHEVLLISCFRELGHKLCNITNGGDGQVGMVPWNKGASSWNKGVPCKEETKLKLSLINMGCIGYKHSEEAKSKIRAANIGNIKPLKYKMIGTHKETGEQIFLFGTKAIKEAGFNSVLVRECAKGLRKSHKGYTWAKEILENK